MANQTFSEERINQALEAAQKHSAALVKGGTPTLSAADAGELSVLAECISVTVSNGEVCLDLPLGLGHVCLPVPSWVPSGDAAQACLSICTTWGFPTGVKVTVSVAGQTIITKTFGKC